MRLTPQTRAVLHWVRRLGHAANSELLQCLLPGFPELTATTVHRITNRLVEAGEIARGPTLGGGTTLDANLAPHDHFHCTNCGGIRDIFVSDAIFEDLQAQLGENLVRRGLLVTGSCEACLKPPSARSRARRT
jgi:Fur family peroxide stress response transcriptional regulator